MVAQISGYRRLEANPIVMVLVWPAVRPGPWVSRHPVF